MITEDYVSFEVAKLLVQKGLRYNDAEYESYYTLKGKFVYFKDNNKEINVAPRFTIQTACKWLREIHNLLISINFSYVSNSYTYLIKYITKHEMVYSDIAESYEKAVEAALKYVLENLI